MMNSTCPVELEINIFSRVIWRIREENESLYASSLCCCFFSFSCAWGLLNLSTLIGMDIPPRRIEPLIHDDRSFPFFSPPPQTFAPFQSVLLRQKQGLLTRTYLVGQRYPDHRMAGLMRREIYIYACSKTHGASCSMQVSTYIRGPFHEVCTEMDGLILHPSVRQRWKETQNLSKSTSSCYLHMHPFQTAAPSRSFIHLRDPYTFAIERRQNANRCVTTEMIKHKIRESFRLGVHARNAEAR